MRRRELWLEWIPLWLGASYASSFVSFSDDLVGRLPLSTSFYYSNSVSYDDVLVRLALFGGHFFSALFADTDTSSGTSSNIQIFDESV